MVVFCKKRCSYEFWKIHKKAPALEPRFKEAADLQSLTLSKKKDSGTCFLVNYAKFLRIPFERTPWTVATA